MRTRTELLCGSVHILLVCRIDLQDRIISTHNFFGYACTKSGSLRFSQFSGCWLILSVYILMSFDFPFGRLFEFGKFVITLISYSLYWICFVYSGVQHILLCTFVLFFFVLCTVCCQFFLRWVLPIRRQKKWYPTRGIQFCLVIPTKSTKRGNIRGFFQTF
jgi:hypothetical protein